MSNPNQGYYEYLREVRAASEEVKAKERSHAKPKKMTLKERAERDLREIYGDDKPKKTKPQTQANPQTSVSASSEADAEPPREQAAARDRTNKVKEGPVGSNPKTSKNSGSSAVPEFKMICSPPSDSCNSNNSRHATSTTLTHPKRPKYSG